MDCCTCKQILKASRMKLDWTWHALKSLGNGIKMVLPPTQLFCFMWKYLSIIKIFIVGLLIFVTKPQVLKPSTTISIRILTKMNWYDFMHPCLFCIATRVSMFLRWEINTAQWIRMPPHTCGGKVPSLRQFAHIGKTTPLEYKGDTKWRETTIIDDIS